MPDFSISAVHKYWNEYQDTMIYRVICFMEGVEIWTLDGNPALEEALKQLGKELDDISKVNFGELGHEEAFIKVACNIKAGRGLRLLQSIDTIHPGSASKVLIYAEENTKSPEDTAGIFLRRNIVFERLRLLARVFSEERLKLVLKSLEGEEVD